MRILAPLRQIHFVGSDDDNVPRRVVQSYIDALGGEHRARLLTIDAFDHDCCWETVWPQAACAALAELGASTPTPCG